MAIGVFCLNFSVNLLLLTASAGLCGYPVRHIRTVAAAVLGGIYTVACLLPGFGFLGNPLWRTVSLIMISVIAYGYSRNALGRGLVFSFFSLVLGNAALGMSRQGVMGIVWICGALGMLCVLHFRGRLGSAVYLPVELHYGTRHVQLTALRDTGNTLKDPITGSQVLVVGADAAYRLTGLTLQQLRKPVESVDSLPGLRLIPCHTVTGNGFLLALRLHNVKIGKWQGSSLVAFAPEGLEPSGAYQALTGGMV